MIRTTLSFCALFGSLILVSKWLQESSGPGPNVAPTMSLESSGTSPREAAPPRQLPSESDTFSVRPPSLRLAAGQSSAIRLVAFDEDPFENADASAARITDLEETTSKASQTDDPGESPADRASSGDGIAAEPKLEEQDSPLESDDAAEMDPLLRLLKEEAAEPSEPAEPELTPELVELRTRLRNCLAHYYFRPENVATRSPWGSMHWMIAYGVDSQLIAGSRRVNAIGYLNYNGVCNGQRLFYVNGGKIQAQVGVGVQGHAGQYLAMLAQSRVKPDYPMLVDGQQFTVADLIEHEKLTCRPASELTFKLIALSHYLKSDEKWKSNDGQTWDIPRLIKEELAQPINGAACGGTHRMTGFSYAVRKRQQRKEPIEGQWLRAKKFVDDFHEYTFKLQNPDASFSTEWFVMRAEQGDIGRRLQTTGHITEWLAFSLNKEQLVEPRMVKSVSYLTDILLEHRHEKWSIGPLGHGLHALAIYDERVFGGKPGTREDQLAEIRKLQLKR